MHGHIAHSKTDGLDYRPQYKKQRSSVITVAVGAIAPEKTLAGDLESVRKSRPWGSKFATFACVSLCQPASPTCGSFKPSRTWCTYSFPNSSACESAPQLSLGAAGDAAGPGAPPGAAPGAAAGAPTPWPVSASFFCWAGLDAATTARKATNRQKRDCILSSWYSLD